ncbi:hypothetical protein ACLKA6_001740 [Drosophila palustris]
MGLRAGPVVVDYGDLEVDVDLDAHAPKSSSKTVGMATLFESGVKTEAAAIDETRPATGSNSPLDVLE